MFLFLGLWGIQIPIEGEGTVCFLSCSTLKACGFDPSFWTPTRFFNFKTVLLQVQSHFLFFVAVSAIVGLGGRRGYNSGALERRSRPGPPVNVRGVRVPVRAAHVAPRRRPLRHPLRPVRRRPPRPPPAHALRVEPTRSPDPLIFRDKLTITPFFKPLPNSSLFNAAVIPEIQDSGPDPNPRDGR